MDPANVLPLQRSALMAIPKTEVVAFMSDMWETPLRDQYWALFKASLSLEEMSSLAKTLPWDDPVARDLDFTVHKRRMSGTLFFCFFPLWIPPKLPPCLCRPPPHPRSPRYFVDSVERLQLVRAHLCKV